jgi:hypothetical protein
VTGTEALTSVGDVESAEVEAYTAAVTAMGSASETLSCTCFTSLVKAAVVTVVAPVGNTYGLAVKLPLARRGPCTPVGEVTRYHSDHVPSGSATDKVALPITRDPVPRETEAVEAAEAVEADEPNGPYIKAICAVPVLGAVTVKVVCAVSISVVGLTVIEEGIVNVDPAVSTKTLGPTSVVLCVEPVAGLVTITDTGNSPVAATVAVNATMPVIGSYDVTVACVVPTSTAMLLIEISESERPAGPSVHVDENDALALA